MVVVKVELWPNGDQTQATTIGQITIANDGVGDAQYGDYDVECSHSGRFFGKRGIYKTGKVKSWPRRLSPYSLLARALAACGIM